MQFGSMLVNYVQALDDSLSRQLNLKCVLRITIYLIEHGELWLQVV